MKEEKDSSARPCGCEDGDGRTAPSRQPRPKTGEISWGLKDEPWVCWIQCSLLPGANKQVDTMQISSVQAAESRQMWELLTRNQKNGPTAGDLSSNKTLSPPHGKRRWPELLVSPGLPKAPEVRNRICKTKSKAGEKTIFETGKTEA